MTEYDRQKQKILVAGGCALDCDLLTNMLEDLYDVEQAATGPQVISMLQTRASEFSLLLLDGYLPEMDGFDVLAHMNRHHWIEEVPVIMTSGGDITGSVERGYGLGVTDFIFRPFDAAMVCARVRNTLVLSARERGLRAIVADQVREKKQGTELMVSILSHIVECRNGESGRHVQHIGVITRLLLQGLVHKTQRYGLRPGDIALISTASAFHDIGKISIPDQVLNKPGPLTPEERKLIETHALAGAEMLASLPKLQWEEPLVKTGYEICRWHHERYDGGGYPDGLKGDDIPISAQVVSLADVYDALTSKRCYKDAYTHDAAMEMILTGQCGVFNPLLLECLKEQAPAIARLTRIGVREEETEDAQALEQVTDQLRSFGLSASERLARKLDLERQQFRFLCERSQEPLFWYTASPSLLNINETCQKLLGLDGAIFDPQEDEALLRSVGSGAFRALLDGMRRTTPARPETAVDVELDIHGAPCRCRFVCRTIWSPEDDSRYTGMVGRISVLDKTTNPAARGLRRASDFMKNGVCVMTAQEAKLAMENLGVVFDTVRLVDVDECRGIELDETGLHCPQSDHCYDYWERGRRCDNCTAATTLATKRQMYRLEYVNEEIHRVQSMYVEVDGVPYVMEMISRVADENMLDGYSRDAVLSAIHAHNKTLYTDPVTQVYNRRYYEDQLRHLDESHSVAMLDLDRFKEINDTWGHQAGDVALAEIAQTIKGCVRASDPVVRYGGDEFLVVFRDIPEDTFRRKLLEIQDKVSAIRVANYPEMRCAVSVGGCRGEGTVAQLLSQADREMYRNKRQRKQLRS